MLYVYSMHYWHGTFQSFIVTSALFLISVNIHAQVARALSPRVSTRRNFFAFMITTPVAITPIAETKCTDIESCRAIGEQKEAEKLAQNPIHDLAVVWNTRYCQPELVMILFLKIHK
jgi:hypothetical protein